MLKNKYLFLLFLLFFNSVLTYSMIKQDTLKHKSFHHSFGIDIMIPYGIEFNTTKFYGVDYEIFYNINNHFFIQSGISFQYNKCSVENTYSVDSIINHIKGINKVFSINIPLNLGYKLKMKNNMFYYLKFGFSIKKQMLFYEYNYLSQSNGHKSEYVNSIPFKDIVKGIYNNHYAIHSYPLYLSIGINSNFTKRIRYDTGIYLSRYDDFCYSWFYGHKYIKSQFEPFFLGIKTSIYF